MESFKYISILMKYIKTGVLSHPLYCRENGSRKGAKVENESREELGRAAHQS
jgi:hypothetical protein